MFIYFRVSRNISNNLQQVLFFVISYIKAKMSKDSKIKELEYLGKELYVKIDRPIRSLHPKFHFEYELNYGFIPNTIGGDGMEIDAYIIGEEQAIKHFTGIVKAIIIRLDDDENKLVVTSKDYPLTEKEIIQKTAFQEKYFKSEIILLKE